MRYTLLPQPYSKISEKRQVELSKLYSKLKGELKRKHGLKVDGGELFNSGYHGLVFTVNGVKFHVLDQPGVIGLEDHRTGYIEVRGNSQSKVLVRHRDKRFGDTDINDEERKAAYSQIPELIVQMYNS